LPPPYYNCNYNIFRIISNLILIWAHAFEDSGTGSSTSSGKALGTFVRLRRNSAFCGTLRIRIGKLSVAPCAHSPTELIMI